MASLVFLAPKNPTFLNSNTIVNPRATGLSVVRLLFYDSITSSNQRLGECDRSKMDSQSAAKEHDCQHTMRFQYASNGAKRRSERRISPCNVLEERLCDKLKEHTCLQNKLEFAFSFRRGGGGGGGHFGVITGMWNFFAYNCAQDTSYRKPQVKIRCAFSFVERKNQVH